MPGTVARATKRLSSVEWSEGPAKRLRTTRAAHTISLFRTLQEDVLDHLMRFTSEKPLSKAWANYVGLVDVQRYVANGHPLRAVALRRFNVVMACDMYPYERRGLLVRGKNSSAIHSFRNTVFELREVVRDIYIYQATFPPLWKRTLSSVCPKLKMLSLNSANMANIFPLEDVLRNQSALECLEMTWGTCTSRQVDSMATHLSGLRRLSLMFDKIEKPFDAVWRTVGPTLEDLAVLELNRSEDKRAANYVPLVLDQLPATCPNIQKLDFELSPQSVRQLLVSLCVSYGKKLTMLILIRCGLTASDLQRVCNACPNARLDLAEFKGLPVDALLAAGKNASLVNFGCNTFEVFDEDKLRNLGNMVGNLTGFCVSAYSKNACRGIATIFQCPKPQLTFARIENDNGQVNSPLTRIIGDRFPLLEQLEITEKLPAFEILQELGPKCPRVKEIIFLNMCSESCKFCLCKEKKAVIKENWRLRRKLISSFLAAVRKFPVLEDVDYSCSQFDGAKSERVDDMSILLRGERPGRKICLTLCGNNYH